MNWRSMMASISSGVGDAGKRKFSIAGARLGKMHRAMVFILAACMSGSDRGPVICSRVLKR